MKGEIKNESLTKQGEEYLEKHGKLPETIGVEENNTPHNIIGKFLKLYANLPMGIRSDIIAVIKKEPMSWSVCYLEIKAKTKLSKEILEYLKEMKFI